MRRRTGNIWLMMLAWGLGAALIGAFQSVGQ